MFAAALDDTIPANADSQSPWKKDSKCRDGLNIFPADTTDRLQPADISINNAAKDLLREYWHAQEVETQLQAGTAENAVEMNNIMGMAVMKEVKVNGKRHFMTKVIKRLVMNGFKNVGIITMVEEPRENLN